MSPEEWKKPRSLCLGAVLAALAAGVQISPLLIPLVGVSLSALSTIPIAFAAYLNPITGFLTYLTGGSLVLLWSFPQAVIFFFTSGLIGLSLGILMKRRCRLIVVACVPAFLLFLGSIAAAKLLGFPLLPWLTGQGRSMLIPIVMLGAFLYTSIWIPVLAALLSRLEKHF